MTQLDVQYETITVISDKAGNAHFCLARDVKS